MEAHLEQVLNETPELDSELLDDRTKVLGVLAADNDGMCLMAKGEIDKGLVALATALSSIASSLEEDAEELPTIIIDTEETQMLIKKESDVSVVIVKKV
jgi:hypothetical protein